MQSEGPQSLFNLPNKKSHQKAVTNRNILKSILLEQTTNLKQSEKSLMTLSRRKKTTMHKLVTIL